MKKPKCCGKVMKSYLPEVMPVRDIKRGNFDKHRFWVCLKCHKVIKVNIDKVKE